MKQPDIGVGGMYTKNRLSQFFLVMAQHRQARQCIHAAVLAPEHAFPFAAAAGSAARSFACMNPSTAV